MTMLGDMVREMLEKEREAPPEKIQRELNGRYPHISLEDAERVRDGLTGSLLAPTKEEQNKRIKDYKALHRELKMKYGQRGK